MIAEQLGCPVADALELIKARAFTEGTPAHSVAERLVGAGLRLG
jgi:hypothetical protein